MKKQELGNILIKRRIKEKEDKKVKLTKEKEKYNLNG